MKTLSRDEGMRSYDIPAAIERGQIVTELTPRRAATPARLTLRAVTNELTPWQGARGGRGLRVGGTIGSLLLDRYRRLGPSRRAWVRSLADAVIAQRSSAVGGVSRGRAQRARDRISLLRAAPRKLLLRPGAPLRRRRILALGRDSGSPAGGVHPRVLLFRSAELRRE